MSTNQATDKRCVCGHSINDHDQRVGECSGCGTCKPDDPNRESNYRTHAYQQCKCPEYRPKAAA